MSPLANGNPPESWVITEVSELRIVDGELWQAVKSRQTKAHKQAISTSAMSSGAETSSDHIVIPNKNGFL